MRTFLCAAFALVFAPVAFSVNEKIEGPQPRVMTSKEVLEYVGYISGERPNLEASFLANKLAGSIKSGVAGMNMATLREVYLLDAMTEIHMEQDKVITALRIKWGDYQEKLGGVEVSEQRVLTQEGVLKDTAKRLEGSENDRGGLSKYRQDVQLLERQKLDNSDERHRLTNKITKLEAKLDEEKLNFQHQDRSITVQRLTVKKMGAKTAEKWQVKNIDLLENLAELRVPMTNLGKLAVVLVGAVGVGVLAAAIYEVLDWKTTLFHDKAVTHLQPRIDIAKKAQSPDDIIREKCMDMHAAATKFEGNAQESSSAIEWETYLNTMRPIYHAAYAQTNAAGVKEINSREIVNWGAPAPSPIAAITPVHASAIQRQDVEEANAQAEEHWSFNEFLRPISLQFGLAEKHRNNIHETALTIIRNSTAFSFATDSDRFYQVYAAYFGRMDIPGGCFKYVKEPKATHAQYKDAREEQAIYESDTRVALEYYFAARSALPVTPPLPANV